MRAVVDLPEPLRAHVAVDLRCRERGVAQELLDRPQVGAAFEQEHVLVRHGKGAKERIVPLGEEAAFRVSRYLHEARPQLVRGTENALFLSTRGRRLEETSHGALATAALETTPR